MSKNDTKRPPGRPRFGADAMKRHNVMLDAKTIEKARRLGNGELSAGIRRAVKEAREP